LGIAVLCGSLALLLSPMGRLWSLLVPTAVSALLGGMLDLWMRE
jgi:hypothetical protein